MLRNFSCRASILALAICLLSITGCSRSLPIDKYVAALERSILSFQEQHEQTDLVYRTAQTATVDASHVDFRFAHPDTQNFISRWRAAETEITSLRAKYNDVLESADMFFTYCQHKAESIQDTDLRQKVTQRIEEKKTSFINAAKKCDGSLDALENSAQKAKDIVASLEVLGALNKLSDKPAQLDQLAENADVARGAVEELVREGRGLVESEFSSLQ